MALYIYLSALTAAASLVFLVPANVPHCARWQLVASSSRPTAEASVTCVQARMILEETTLRTGPSRARCKVDNRSSKKNENIDV